MLDNARLVAAWLAARSVARGLPSPVEDRGGFRVDTLSDEERCRWVFPFPTPGLAELGREISEPRYLLKLCGPGKALAGLLPARWKLQPQGYFMVAGNARPVAASLPPGYRMDRQRHGELTHVRVIAADGAVAASGFAAETEDVFVFDRIATAPDHRRRGLARAVMAELELTRRSPAAVRALVATEQGRLLYESLGWSVFSPYSTAAVTAA